MTKARARKRAKAKAAMKSRKPQTPEDKAGAAKDKSRPGQFDAKSNSMRNASGANVKSFSGMKRGAARSR